jgi:hypothetical protein
MKKLMILATILSAAFLLMSCAALERSSLLGEQATERTADPGAVDPNEVGSAAPIPYETPHGDSRLAPMPGESNTPPVPAAAPPPPANNAVPGKLTLPPGTPVALRTLTVTLIPPKSNQKVTQFYITFMDPPGRKFKAPAKNVLTFKNMVKPGETYYLNFGFSNTTRWLVNNEKLDGEYMYGRILIAIDDQPPVEFTKANIVAPDGAHRNIEVYVP